MRSMIIVSALLVSSVNAMTVYDEYNRTEEISNFSRVTNVIGKLKDPKTSIEQCKAYAKKFVDEHRKTHTVEKKDLDKVEYTLYVRCLQLSLNSENSK